MLKSVVTPEKSHGKMHFDTLAPFASLLLSVIKSRTLGREGFGSLSPYTIEKKPQQHLYTRAVGTWKNDDEALNLRGRGSLFSDQTDSIAMWFHPTFRFSSIHRSMSRDCQRAWQSFEMEPFTQQHMPPSRTQEVHQQPWNVEQK
jgi:hypothetical protein